MHTDEISVEGIELLENESRATQVVKNLLKVFEEIVRTHGAEGVLDLLDQDVYNELGIHFGRVFVSAGYDIVEDE